MKVVYKVQPVNLEEEADILLDTYLAGFGDTSAIVNMFFPIDHYPKQRDKILRQSADSIRGEKEDPHLQWVKIVDTKSAMMASALQWRFFESNPYSDPKPPINPKWFPEGSSEYKLAEVVFNDYVAPRAPMRGRPHAWINNMFTRPEYTGHGMAGALIEWGLKKADKMGLESHVEASPLGRPVYARYGFIQVATNHLLPDNPGNEKEWGDLLEEFKFPQLIYLMWRPPGGNYEEGKTPIPWKGGLKPSENWKKLFQ